MTWRPSPEEEGVTFRETPAPTDGKILLTVYPPEEPGGTWSWGVTYLGHLIAKGVGPEGMTTDAGGINFGGRPTEAEAQGAAEAMIRAWATAMLGAVNGNGHSSPATPQEGEGATLTTPAPSSWQEGPLAGFCEASEAWNAPSVLRVRFAFPSGVVTE